MIKVITKNGQREIDKEKIISCGHGKLDKNYTDTFDYYVEITNDECNIEKIYITNASYFRVLDFLEYN